MSPATSLALVNKLHPALRPRLEVELVELAAGSPLLLEQLVSGDAVSPTLVHAVRARVTALPSVTIEQLAVLALHGRPLPRHLLGPRRCRGGAAGGCGARARASRRSPPRPRPARRRRRRPRRGTDPAGDPRPAGDRLRRRRRGAPPCSPRGSGSPLPSWPSAGPASAAPAEAAQLLAMAVEARGDDASVRLRLDAAAALIAVNQPAAAADALAAGFDDGANVAERAEAGWYRSQAAWLKRDERAAARHCDDALALVRGRARRSRRTSSSSGSTRVCASASATRP